MSKVRHNSHCPCFFGALGPDSSGSMLPELRLRDPGTHDAGGGRPTRDDGARLVDEFGATPLLVRQGLHLVLALLTLDELYVGRGAALRVVLGEEIDAQGVAVEARQRDDLPAEAQFRKVPDKG